MYTGERAGNAALEELVMALHVRKAYYNKYFNRPEDSPLALTNIQTKEIYKTIRLVSTLTGIYDIVLYRLPTVLLYACILTYYA